MPPSETVLPSLQSGATTLSTGNPGPVEAAVASELAGVAEGRPSLIAIAVRLAADLDNGIFVSSHAGLSRELMRVLDRAHRVPGSHARLASVSKLSDRSARR